MPETMEQAVARYKREKESALELERRAQTEEAERAKQLWPLTFRDQMAKFTKGQQAWNADVIRQVNDIFGDLARAHNALAAMVIQLRDELAAERTARLALEAVPRQTINLTLPERESNVTVELPTPNVTVEVPKRTTQTEIERDGAGRITRTTQREVDAENAHG